jgi:hypothetical protein
MRTKKMMKKKKKKKKKITKKLKQWKIKKFLNLKDLPPF